MLVLTEVLGIGVVFPANGQRTKTNARTRKGKKRTIGLGKKAI